MQSACSVSVWHAGRHITDTVTAIDASRRLGNEFMIGALTGKTNIPTSAADQKQTIAPAMRISPTLVNGYGLKCVTEITEYLSCHA